MSDRFEIKADVAIDAAGTVTGIAWPFGSPDSVGDIIEKGAFGFANSLPMVMEHDQKQVIGIWETFAETDKGLEVKGRLFVEGIEPARDAHRALKAGKIGGLSIGFRHNGFEPRAEGGRVFKSITVNEISLCRRPVHPGARVTVVKSINGESNLESELNNEPIAKSDPVIDPKTLDEMKARMDKLEAKLARPVAANNNQPIASNDNAAEKKAFASFLRTGVKESFEGKALTVAADAPNYVLAPKDASREFIRNLVEFSPVRGIADVRTTGTHTVTLPKRTAVTNALWKGEAVASGASQPAFDQMEIAIKEMTTHVDLSNWMIEDAEADVEAEVRMALAEDFAAKEGLAFVGGSLAVEPQGFMSEATITQSLNGHATNVSADALIKMLYSLPASFRTSGTWVMNGTTLGLIRTLKDGAGNYLWQPGYQAGQPETILGRPVTELKDMPDVAANAFPIVYGDFKQGYRIYDRLDLSVLANPYLLQTEGLIRYHARRRVGAGVVRPEVFRKLKMATS
jgi:HK97 family phage major capsid protein/HK97 family phage prohead protease